MVSLMSVSEALLLIALAAAYVVIYLAKREGRVLKLIGYVIAGFIIGVVIAYMFANVWLQGQMCSAKARYYHMMMQPRLMQPLPAPKR